LATEANLSRGADMTTDPAIGRINLQVDADVVAIGEPRIAAMFASALASEADLSRGTDVAAQPAVSRVSLAVDADPVAKGEAFGARRFPHEETVPAGASDIEPWLRFRADVAAGTAVVDISLQIEADPAAIGGAGWADNG
jgi:hypothetical protein